MISFSCISAFIILPKPVSVNKNRLFLPRDGEFNAVREKTPQRRRACGIVKNEFMKSNIFR